MAFKRNLQATQRERYWKITAKFLNYEFLAILTQYFIAARHLAQYFMSKVKRAQKHNQKVNNHKTNNYSL